MKLRSRVPSLERFAVNAIRQQTFRHVPRSNLLLTIDNNAAAAHLAQVLWSPDSKRVAVVEDYPARLWRVCGLVLDEDGAAVIKQAQGFVFVSVARHRQSILIFLEL